MLGAIGAEAMSHRDRDSIDLGRDEADQADEFADRKVVAKLLMSRNISIEIQCHNLPLDNPWSSGCGRQKVGRVLDIDVDEKGQCQYEGRPEGFVPVRTAKGNQGPTLHQDDQQRKERTEYDDPMSDDGEDDQAKVGGEGSEKETIIRRFGNGKRCENKWKIRTIEGRPVILMQKKLVTVEFCSDLNDRVDMVVALAGMLEHEERTISLQHHVGLSMPDQGQRLLGGQGLKICTESRPKLLLWGRLLVPNEL
ncbi:hypothetical protein AKJ16_DCAP25139 [Drosera capensis]